MTTLYIDAFAGAAGDMLIGALVDLGFDIAALHPILDALELPHDTLEIKTVMRGALACKKFVVHLPGQDDPHEHEHEHEHHHHDHEHGHEHHHHDHDHHHHHDHDHDHGHDHSHDHAHRAYREIVELIDALPYSKPVRDKALRALRRLGDAEAKMHGIGLDEVHFHEVGAQDSIIDMVGFCVAMEQLGITRLVCSPLTRGRGMIKCAHGELPLPAPATLELLRDVPSRPAGRDGEHVTPTAAALLATLADEFGDMPAGVVEAIGYGAGTRDPKHGPPNAVRAALVDQSGAGREAGETLIVEAGIDDMDPQLFPVLEDALLAAGAVDIAVLATQMKKGRPGMCVRAVTKPDRLDAVADAFLTHSTTIGIRYWPVARIVGERTMQDVETEFGPIRVKVTHHRGKLVNAKPEFEDCKAAAQKAGTSVKDVVHAAIAAFRSSAK
ncbi:MAG: nickel pincer cofactor biosynthesis protein LarC [Deltaproteobacteria bacterium]|nr:nickel pincer cofactor biosynthesis protein LarC [Deltaproteobacteria bacterium]